MDYSTRSSGFTLIELSIVLVIIGLIVGGILVGQDLIKAAEVRAQISQIEKYNQAVNTFRGKFGGLPGDLALATANQFGFDTGSGGTYCNGAPGMRNGDGLIGNYPGGLIFAQGNGEVDTFWEDLSSPIAGNLIEGTFPNGGIAITNCAGISTNLTSTPGTTYIGDLLPVGKIGHGTFVYVYANNGFNWFGLSAATGILSCCGWLLSTPTIPVFQAYSIDKKIDDGLPTTGSVVIQYINSPWQQYLSPSAAADSTTSCYNTTSNAYSVSSLANYGAGGNCALSFRFQ